MNEEKFKSVREWIERTEDLNKELGIKPYESAVLNYKTLMELVDFADKQVAENYKLKHQAKLSSYEFARCLETKEKMIELLIKEFLVGTSFYYSKYDNMNEEDLYRHFEQEAMVALKKEKKK